MNRIILVGNGFDLAHHLKTSYADFINWYWGEWGDKLRGAFSEAIEDRLCSFKIKNEVGLGYIANAWNGGYYTKEDRFKPWNPHMVTNLAKTDTNTFEFTYKDYFFKEVCNSVENKGWVDIENIFYDYLSHKSQFAVETKKVNDDLDYLRENLVKYLTMIEQSIKPDILKSNIKKLLIKPFVEEDFAINAKLKWYDIFDQRFEYDDLMWEGLISSYFNKSDTIHYNIHGVLDYVSKHKSNGIKDNEVIPDAFLLPDRTMLLNFNYTQTADMYLSDSPGVLINHIHGDLSKPESIIFGYGDELDETYKTIVNTNDNEYLRNMKSIKYMESSNYRELLKFIESDAYQIFIMGHSCGNSDRTLLNTLFEHKNCVSIKPFYHEKSDGTDNYIELVQNISRNFTDMKLMRDRVVNKTFCEPLSKYNPVEQSYYYYTDRIMNLYQAIFNGEVVVAKPVLLLALIDGIGQGIFKENKFVLNEWLEDRYLKLMAENTSNSQFDRPMDIANPFLDLVTDGFLHLLDKEMFAMKITPSKKWLKESISYAYFDYDLWILLQNQPWREKLRNFIVEQKLTIKK